MHLQVGGPAEGLSVVSGVHVPAQVLVEVPQTVVEKDVTLDETYGPSLCRSSISKKRDPPVTTFCASPLPQSLCRGQMSPCSCRIHPPGSRSRASGSSGCTFPAGCSPSKGGGEGGGGGGDTQLHPMLLITNLSSQPRRHSLFPLLPPEGNQEDVQPLVHTNQIR